MTRDKAISELVRIWHSPHLDLILKARLTEVIETLKEKNQSDSLVTDSSDACKESKSKLDLVRRQAVLDALEESGYCYHFWLDFENIINSLPSAEPKTGEWVRNDNGTYSCCVCQSWIPEEQHSYARYCLYCGARMLGEGGEADETY